MTRLWTTEIELAEVIMVRVARKRDVTLTPGTAHFVAVKLMTAGAKPTCDEIAKLLCDHKCPDEPCFMCRGKANEVVHVYGQRVR